MAICDKQYLNELKACFEKTKFPFQTYPSGASKLSAVAKEFFSSGAPIDSKKKIFKRMVVYAISCKREDFLRFCQEVVTKEFLEKVSSKSFNEIVRTFADLPVTASPNKKSFLTKLAIIPEILDTMLVAFGILNIGQIPETLWDFQAVVTIYARLFAFPEALAITIAGLISPTLPTFFSITAALFIFATAVLAYVEYLRPCPNRLRFCENLTHKASINAFPPCIGRETELRDLLNAYSNQSRFSHHSLLIGPPGVGKTEIVHELAKRLKGKRIFRLQLHDLSGSFVYSKDRLRQVTSLLKGHENKVVLYIDEIHEIFKDNTLKLALTDIIYAYKIQVIASTTNRDYEECKNQHAAFFSRFNTMEIKPPDDETLKSILLAWTKWLYPESFAETSFYSELIKIRNQNGISEPRSSIQLLQKAINFLKGSNGSKTISKKRESEERHLLELQRDLEFHILENNNALQNNIKTRKDAILKLVNNEDAISKSSHKIRHWIKQRFELLESLKLRAQEGSLIRLSGSKKNRAEKQFLFDFFLCKVLNKMIPREAKGLPKDVYWRLDKKLMPLLSNAG